MDACNPLVIRNLVDTVQDQISHLRKAVEHTIENGKEKGFIRETTASNDSKIKIIPLISFLTYFSNYINMRIGEYT